MLVKLVEVFKPEGERLYVDEIHVSPDAVKMIRKETNVNMINEAHALGIVNNAEFSRITINEGSHSRTITVIGSPEELRRKLNKRQILRG
tara:strand:- start:2135 stop:2404 length:270 start_codon:yes stop_codon:yes gene_type:complete